MKRIGRIARAISVALSFALISVSFGPEAWAQTVPLLDRAAATPPTGAGSANAQAVGNASAVVMPASGSLTASPLAAPSIFLPVPSAAAAAPNSVPAGPHAMAHAASALAVSAAAPAIEEGDDTAKPSAQAPAAERRSTDPERMDTRTYWDSHKAALLAQAQKIKDRLDDYARRRALDVSLAEFEQELEKNKILVKDPALGKAEMTLVEGRRFVRVVQSPTELSFLFLDADSVPRDSKHLRQIIARQLFDSGADRTDGRRGRNPVVVWQRNGRTIETEFHQKPALSNLGWWRQYWRATYKTPSLSSLKFGLFMGGAQGVLAWGVAGLNLLMTATAISFAPIAFTVVFGALIGTFTSSYRNWTYRGSALSQLLKSALISLAFAYPVIIFTHGLFSLTLAINALILFNVGMNNAGKVAWQAIPRMFEKHQHYLSSRPLFWGFKAGDLLNQGFYMINWTLRLIALLIPTWAGYAPMLIGMGVGMWVSYWYAKRHHYPEAARMREEPRRLLQRARSALRSLLR